MENAKDKFQRAIEGLHTNGSRDQEDYTSIHLASLLASIRYIKANNRKATNIDADVDVDDDVGDIYADNNDVDGDNHSSMGMMIRTSMNYNNKIKDKMTLRSLVGSKGSMTQLIQSLSDLVSHRTNAYRSDNDTAKNNDEDNDDVDGECDALDEIKDQRTEWTVSSKALMAARSYIELSSMEGSWGAGLIDVGVMKNIEALVRRWGEECRGKTLKKGTHTNNTGNGAGTGTGTCNSDFRKGRDSLDGSDGDSSCTNKRKRNGEKHDLQSKVQRYSKRDRNRVVGAESDNDQQNDHNRVREREREREESAEATNSNKSIILHGMELANAIGGALNCQDYWNWNKDARDAMMDAATSALGVIGALAAPFQSNTTGNSPGNGTGTGSTGTGIGAGAGTSGGYSVERNKRSLGSTKLWKTMDEVNYCSRVVTTISTAIQTCIVDSLQSRVSSKSRMNRDRDDIDGYLLSIQENGSDSIPSRGNSGDSKHMTVSFLRASYPLLTGQADLPNGQKGRTCACKYVSKLVVNILKVLSLRVETKENMDRMVSSSVHKTPATTGKRGTRSVLITKTPRSASKGAPSGRKTPRSRRKSFDGNLIVPPSLKKNATPRSTNKPQSLASKSRTIIDIFVGMMQKISTSRGMERADTRGRIASFLNDCMDVLPESRRKIFLKSVTQLCRSKVSSHRIFGVELIGSFLLAKWMWSENMTNMRDADQIIIASVDSYSSKRMSRESSEFPLDKKGYCLTEDNALSTDMLSALIGRLNDRVPAVRARAAAAISMSVNGMNKITNSEDQSRFQQCVANFKVALLSTLRERAMNDKKATVRRNVIVALSDLLLFFLEPLDEMDVSALSEMCNDVSIAVRRSAVESIVSLIDKYSELEGDLESVPLLEVVWVDSVLPLVNDPENSCGTKVVESFLDLVISPIIGNNDGESTDDIGYKSTWRMLSRISVSSSSAGSFKGSKSALHAAFKEGFKSLEHSNQREVFVELLTEVHRNISEGLDDSEDRCNDRVIGSWCFLECMTSLQYEENKEGPDHFDLEKEIKQSRIGTDFLLNYWNFILQLSGDSNNSKEKAKLSAIAKCCLRVIAAFAPIMTSDEAANMFSSLRASIASFSLDIDIIGSSVIALVKITERLYIDSEENQARSVCEDWITDTLGNCESVLRKFMVTKASCHLFVDRVLYSVGELIMVGFDPSQDKYDKLIVPDGSSKQTCIRGLFVNPSSSLCELVQSLLLPTLPNEDGESVEARVPHKLRAHAFIAFGKICLRDEILAKNSVNLFARELRQEGEYSDPAVKSNAIMVLGDFSIRYTHYVDRFIPLMASCLQPGNTFTRHDHSDSIVRHHTILILSNLILQDYIKWKGILFYRFLAAMVDEDPTVSNLAKLLLCGPLLTKQPSLFFNNFVDALFILNGCTAHPMFANRKDKDGLCLQADGLNYFRIEDATKRNEIYSLLLNHMSDEEKIGITARLSKEILSTATEMKGDLRSAASSQDTRVGGAYSVLSDCFQILINPNMRIGRSQQANEDNGMNMTTHSSTTNAALLSSAKGKLLSKISRKHLIETVLPILCTLKRILERSRSPLLKNLMQYLVSIFRQFKKEVNETLASNQTLLQEIQFDTRNFEKNEKKNSLHPQESAIDILVS